MEKKKAASGEAAWQRTVKKAAVIAGAGIAGGVEQRALQA